MKTFMIKFTRMLSSFILGALGFSACSDDLNSDNQLCMYGTPTWDFQVDGFVTDAENNPIKGLRVVLNEQYDSNRTTQTLTTDENGRFVSQTREKLSRYSGDITITDIDGEENGGLFAETNIQLNDYQPNYLNDQEDSDAWHRGNAIYELNISIPKQENTDE